MPHTAIVNVKTVGVAAALLLTAVEDELSVLPWALNRVPVPSNNSACAHTRCAGRPSQARSCPARFSVHHPLQMTSSGGRRAPTWMRPTCVWSLSLAAVWRCWCTCLRRIKGAAHVTLTARAQPGRTCDSTLPLQRLLEPAVPVAHHGRGGGAGASDRAHVLPPDGPADAPAAQERR